MRSEAGRALLDGRITTAQYFAETIHPEPAEGVRDLLRGPKRTRYVSYALASSSIAVYAVGAGFAFANDRSWLTSVALATTGVGVSLGAVAVSHRWPGRGVGRRSRTPRAGGKP